MHSSRSAEAPGAVTVPQAGSNYAHALRSPARSRSAKPTRREPAIAIIRGGATRAGLDRSTPCLGRAVHL